MGSNKGQTDEKLPVNLASRVSFCQRNKSENGSFVNKLRNRFHEFIHASMDEHKRCLRDTMHKMFNASKIFEKRVTEVKVKFLCPFNRLQGTRRLSNVLPLFRSVK